MNDVILHLKDGQSRAIAMPDGRTFQYIVHYMRTPADAAGSTVRLRLPTGDALDVPASEIASLEIPPPHVLVRDFMTEAELQQILDFMLSHTETFQSSGTYDARTQGDTGVGRRSRILDGPGNAPMAALMMPKLQALMPTLWPQLRMAPISINALECQVTAHGDGDFFGTHTDNSPADIAYRRISYVLYFHRDPKQFSGGHLHLYNTLIQNGYGQCGQLGADIDPPRNGLMVFPTHIYHGVTPIQCASSDVTDHRLTLNGWLF